MVLVMLVDLHGQIRDVIEPMDYLSKMQQSFIEVFGKQFLI